MAALAEACRTPDFPAEIVAVISDRDGVAGLDRARDRGLATQIVAPGDFADRAAWNLGLADAVSAWQPDWVVSAGFMRILSAGFLERFPNRVVNTHPALLPSFPGAHAVPDALAYGVKVTGSTIHLVDAGVDTGPIIAQRAVPVHADDDEASLHERIKEVERDLLVDVVSALAQRGVNVEGRKVTIP